MSANSDPRFPFRLALSHREKAHAALNRADRSYARGEIDQAHHANLRAGYERERKIADRTLDRLAGAERARLQSLEAQRRTALEEQLHLTERVAAGKLTARAANDKNRRLIQRLAQIDEMLASCRERLEARTSEELGGFIDLPFDGYLRAGAGSFTGGASRVPIESPRDSSRDWLVAMVVALLASLAVFLPWVTTDSLSMSLLGAGGTLSRHAAHVGAARLFWHSAWIFYLIVPFAGVVFASRKGPPGGWGTLLTGVTLLAGAVLPGLLVGTGIVRPSAYADLLGMLHMGPLVYATCGVCLVVLGAVRISPANDNLRHAIFVSASLSGVLACITIVVIFVLNFLSTEPRVQFEAVLDSRSKDRVLLTFRNDGAGTVNLYVPWPDASTADPRSRSRSAVGVRLYVKERGEGDYRLAPYSKTVWTAPGAPVLETSAIELNAGLTFQSVLDLRQLSVLGADAEIVRLQFTRSDGELLSEVHVPLGERYLSPQGEERQAPVTTASVGRPPQPHVPNVAGETAKGLQSSAAPLYAQFTGMVGGAAVVRVYLNEQARGEDVAVVAGTELHPGWSVESVSRQPAMLTVVHSATGTRVTMPRGEVVKLSAALPAPPAAVHAQ